MRGCNLMLNLLKTARMILPYRFSTGRGIQIELLGCGETAKSSAQRAFHDAFLPGQHQVVLGLEIGEKSPARDPRTTRNIIERSRLRGAL